MPQAARGKANRLIRCLPATRPSIWGWVTDIESGAGVVFTQGGQARTERFVPEGSQASHLRDRVAIRHDVAGDLRFISHHDTLRLWERALARAAIPVKFSEGFNPRPRMSLALPRSVGIASSDELLVIELSEPIDLDEVRSRLGQHMPTGMSITHVERVEAGDRRLPIAAEYEVSIDSGAEAALAARVSAILSETNVFVDRATPGMANRHIDVRPYITAITVEPQRLWWTQSITTTGTVRPNEMLELLGLVTGDHLHRLRRVAVTYGR